MGRVSARVRAGVESFHAKLHGLTPTSDLIVGDNSYIAAHTYSSPTIVRFNNDAPHPVTIGKYCSISRNVEFFIGGEHKPEWVTTFPLRAHFDLPGAGADGLPATRGPIVIGNDVWIGFGATLLSGVELGDGCVVGAQAVVRNRVPPYAIVAGNPAKLVRYRFPPHIIESLLRIKWWDWPEADVRAHVDALSSDDLTAFCTRFDPAFAASSTQTQ